MGRLSRKDCRLERWGRRALGDAEIIASPSICLPFPSLDVLQPGLKEVQKRGYRVAAEVLLTLFREYYPRVCADRLTLRLDTELVIQVRLIGASRQR